MITHLFSSPLVKKIIPNLEMRQKIMLPFPHHTDADKPARVLWPPGEVNFGSIVSTDPLKWSHLKTFKDVTTLRWGISGDRPYSVAIEILSSPRAQPAHWSKQTPVLSCSGLPSGWVFDVTLHLCMGPAASSARCTFLSDMPLPFRDILLSRDSYVAGPPQRRWQKLWAEPQGLLRYNPLGMDSHKLGA